MTLEINRIYCGDCLELMKKIPDKSIDLVLTDPPYGIGVSTLSNSNERWRHPPKVVPEKIGWDTDRVIAAVPLILQKSNNQIIFGGNYYADLLPPSKCWIVWDKKNAGGFAECELALTSYNKPIKKFSYLWSGFRKQEPEERNHPTQKPLKLMEWCLLKYSQPGDTILDPFLGSGTTAVACKRTGRNFIGIEKEPMYVEIALKRLEKVNNKRLTDFSTLEGIIA
jgi:site-specific DNA-methyltransferase (adenine-specific)